MKLVVRKNHLNSCYKTIVDRAQWQGSVIGICPVCFTSDHLDDDINSQTFIKTLSRLLSVVDVAEKCSLEGLRMAFAISGNNLQQKLRLLLIPSQASRKLVNQNYTLLSMVINNCNSVGNNCGSRIIMSLRQLLCWAAGNCKNP